MYAETKTTIIEPEEFTEFLNAIKKENALQVLGTGDKKYHYHDFLKTAYKCALLCGLRREQLCTLRYNMIRENKEGLPDLIISKNLKVNRIKASSTGGERTIPTPVTPQLRSLLINELDYEKYKGTDRYLIAGDTNLNRNHLMDLLSRSFSHFWKQTGNPKEANFADLRKTFINRMQLALGDSARLVTGHQSNEVMDKHYLDKEFFAKIAGTHSIFPEIEIEDRKQEISKVREHKQNEISIER